jgi:hypothetical protein
MLGLIDWVKVKGKLTPTATASTQTILLDLAMSTVMFTALVSAPSGSGDKYPLLSKYLFPAVPIPGGSEEAFWQKNVWLRQ